MRKNIVSFENGTKLVEIEELYSDEMKCLIKKKIVMFFYITQHCLFP